MALFFQPSLSWVRFSNLASNGFVFSTSPNPAAMASKRKSLRPRVRFLKPSSNGFVFSTFQSLPRMGSKRNSAPPAQIRFAKFATSSPSPPFELPFRS